jgi:hypothetical protein
MAKVTTVEKHGSVGPSVFQSSPYGTIERQRVKPRNPRTLRQQTHRQHLAAVSSLWGGLTEEQRVGWAALAAQLRGNLTGQHVHNRTNVILADCGQPGLAAAPAVPAFGPLTCAGLVVDDTPRVRLLQVGATSGAERLIVEACTPVGAGVQSVKHLFRYVTVVVAPAEGSVDLDLTAAYIERFCVPQAGQRVAVRLTAMKSGFRDTSSVRWSTLVAAHKA